MLFLTCCLFTLTAAAQHPPLIDSRELLTEGNKFYQAENYKEAIRVFSKIPRSDTNYNKALHDLSLAAYEDSNLVAAKWYAEEGLRLYPAQATDWYSLLANALQKMGEREKALVYYDKILAIDKNNHLAYFNKGIVLLNMEKPAEAKACLQQCLLINPFYSSAHFFLGYIAIREGRLPEAMMSYAANLVMNPGNSYFRRSIKALSEISQMQEEVESWPPNANLRRKMTSRWCRRSS